MARRAWVALTASLSLWGVGLAAPVPSRPKAADAGAPASVAQQHAEVDAQVEKEHVEETLRLALVEARSYEIRVAAGPVARLELNPKSILRWSNPITGAYGELLVWTRQGRPLVIASVYQYYLPDRYLAIAFQSLSPGKLIAT